MTGTVGMHTYAILCGNHVKVGRSSNVRQRLRQIQTSVPLPAVLLGVVAGDIERETHKWLSECGVTRTSGEWFEYTEQAHDALMAQGLVAKDADGFGPWITQQTHRDDPIGDLARDIKRDQNWPPQSMTKEGIRHYLQWRGACPEALRAFDRAWKEWSP